MRIVNRLAGRVVLATCLAVVWVSAGPFANTVDFEGLLTGQSVDGQAGWSVVDEFGFTAGPAFDEEVVDDGTGNTVWRFSNAVGRGSLSDQPYSHLSTDVAGESGSALWNDRGTDHTMPLSPPNPRAFATVPTFHGQFRFRSATGAAQSDLSIDVSPSAKQSTWRNGFVRISDDGANGLDVLFYETGLEADPFGASQIVFEIAGDLSYTEWHTIDIYVLFLDDANPDTSGNDCVTILVDGAVVHSGTTWESYYRGSNPAGLNVADQPQLQAVDSLAFYYRGSDVSANSGNGLYFDDVVVENTTGPLACPIPLPSVTTSGLVTLCLIFLVALAVVATLQLRGLIRSEG